MNEGNQIYIRLSDEEFFPIYWNFVRLIRENGLTREIVLSEYGAFMVAINSPIDTCVCFPDEQNYLKFLLTYG